MGKNKGKTTWVVLAILWLCSCTAYKAELQFQKLKQPVLATVVQEHAKIIGERTKEVGHLKLDNPLPLKVIEVPFNKHSYGKYLSFLKNARRANTVPFNDSLPLPPRYIQLQLADQVTLTQLLNAPENKALKDYIIQDADHELVATIKFTTNDNYLAAFINASHVFLAQDNFGKPYFSLLEEENERFIYFEELQIFDSETLSFCWAEDKYFKKHIVNLLEKGARCPKGAYKKAVKAEREREYLKF